MNYVEKIGLFAGFTIMNAINYYQIMTIVTKKGDENKAIGEALLLGSITSVALSSTTNNIKKSAIAFFPILIGVGTIKYFSKNNINNGPK